MDKQVSAPKPGDVIYVDSRLFLSHGKDDLHGGKATVRAVQIMGSQGKQVPFVEVVENPGWFSNWAVLAEKQTELAAKFGDTWAHAMPDLRPEFNDD
jgi:hypothetical protein